MDIIEVPPADDRTKEEPDDPGVPSLGALKMLWLERDVLYAKRDRALSDEQIEAVRVGRRKEANALPMGDRKHPSTERARGWALANSWYPPEHGQGVAR